MDGNTVSVDVLRRDLSTVLRDVRAGATFTVTDHGEAIAEIVPVRPHAWIPAARVDALLRDLGSDTSWLEAMASARSEEPARDPWELPS